jgi:peptide alpha-N-acetyltransferase
MGGKLVGAILCKAEAEKGRMRGYVGMFAVAEGCRKWGIGGALACAALGRLAAVCEELVLETEVTNAPALRLYEGLGFVRDKRLPKYYLNGNDAYRLKCWLA